MTSICWRFWLGLQMLYSDILTLSTLSSVTRMLIGSSHAVSESPLPRTLPDSFSCRGDESFWHQQVTEEGTSTHWRRNGTSAQWRRHQPADTRGFLPEAEIRYLKPCQTSMISSHRSNTVMMCFFFSSVHYLSHLLLFSSLSWIQSFLFWKSFGMK